MGYHEKKTLLEWVRSRVKNYPVPDNFSSGWKDGILLCALLDSMYPGSCPRYDLLNADNCISNAQLAFFLLEKHTPIRPVSCSLDCVALNSHAAHMPSTCCSKNIR